MKRIVLAFVLISQIAFCQEKENKYYASIETVGINTGAFDVEFGIKYKGKDYVSFNLLYKTEFIQGESFGVGYILPLSLFNEGYGDDIHLFQSYGVGISYKFKLFSKGKLTCFIESKLECRYKFYENKDVLIELENHFGPFASRTTNQTKYVRDFSIETNYVFRYKLPINKGNKALLFSAIPGLSMLSRRENKIVNYQIEESYGGYDDKVSYEKKQYLNNRISPKINFEFRVGLAF